MAPDETVTAMSQLNGELSRLANSGGLQALANVRFWGVANRTNSGDLETLDRLVHDRYPDLIEGGEWLESLRRLIDDAQQQMKPAPLPNLPPGESAQTRDLVGLIFGTDQPGAASERRLDGRRLSRTLESIVHKHYHRTWSTSSSRPTRLIQQISRNVREDLATAILDYQQRELDTGNSSSDYLPWPATLSYTFDQLLRSSKLGPAGIVNIWGPSGLGKTYSSVLFLRSTFGTDRSAVIQGFDENDGSYRQSLIRALVKCGGSIDGRSVSDLELDLASELTSGQHLAAVLFDDVSPDVVQRVLPNSMSTICIVTTKTRMPVQGWRHIRAVPFSDELANDFIKTRLPTASKSEIETLCGYLGNWPLLLDAASRAVVSGLVTLEAVNASFAMSAVTTTDQLNSFDDILEEGLQANTSPLSLIFRQLLHQVGDVGSDARRALDCILWTTGPCLTSQLFGAAFDHVEIDDLRARVVVDRLVRLGIVDLSDDGLFVTINDLMLRILREITSSTSEDVARSFFARIRSVEAYVIAKDAGVNGGALSKPRDLRTANSVRNGLATCLALNELALVDILSSSSTGVMPINSILLWWGPEALQVEVRHSQPRHIELWSREGCVTPAPSVTERKTAIYEVAGNLADAQAREPWVSREHNLLWHEFHIEQSAVRHMQISFFSPSFLRMRGIATWALCGLLVSPEEEVLQAELPLCSDCSEMQTIGRLAYIHTTLGIVGYAMKRTLSNLRHELRVINSLVALGLGTFKVDGLKDLCLQGLDGRAKAGMGAVIEAEVYIGYLAKLVGSRRRFTLGDERLFDNALRDLRASVESILDPSAASHVDCGMAVDRILVGSFVILKDLGRKYTDPIQTESIKLTAESISQKLAHSSDLEREFLLSIPPTTVIGPRAARGGKFTIGDFNCSSELATRIEDSAGSILNELDRGVGIE